MATREKRKKPGPGKTTPSGRGRGRPRKSGEFSTDARTEIMEAAATLFSRQGIDSTTIADIANAISVQPPSIYYHFADKQAIVEALLEFVIDESAAFATSMARQEGSPAARLRELVAYHVRRLVSAPYDFWFVSKIAPRPPSSLKTKKIAREVKAWLKAVAVLVEAAVAAGELKPVRREVALEMVSSMVHGALALKHEGKKVEADEIAIMYVRALGGVVDQ